MSTWNFPVTVQAAGCLLLMTAESGGRWVAALVRRTIFLFTFLLGSFRHWPLRSTVSGLVTHHLSFRIHLSSPVRSQAVSFWRDHPRLLFSKSAQISDNQERATYELSLVLAQVSHCNDLCNTQSGTPYRERTGIIFVIVLVPTSRCLLVGALNAGGAVSQCATVRVTWC